MSSIVKIDTLWASCWASSSNLPTILNRYGYFRDIADSLSGQLSAGSKMSQENLWARSELAQQLDRKLAQNKTLKKRIN